MKMISSQIYARLPVWAQNLAVSAFGYSWNKRRFGGIFQSELVKFKQRENYTLDEWRLFQTTELRKILVNAILNVPFYRQKYREAGISLNDLKSFALTDLKLLPPLEKNDLRLFGKSQLLSEKIDQRGAFFSSSGSTGTPTEIYISHKMHQKWSAGFEARIRIWAGVNLHIPRGTIGGRRIVPDGEGAPPFYRYNIIERQTYFSAYHISAQNVSSYLEGMEKHGVEYMTGYAMSNFFLARFIEESGLKAPKLKAIITSSEKLTADMRSTLERVYQCKSFDSYSGVEVCGLISECEFGSLHISPDLGVLEILKDNGDFAKPGETGELYCTGLLNHDQPLIRYKIGDLVTLSKEQQCKCGRFMPIVEEIVGRVEDTILGKDGRMLVRFHGIFINIPSIIEGQIIQHQLDVFEVRLVTSNAITSAEEQLIINRLQSQLGKDIKITINIVQKIEKNQNGKFKAVISYLK